MFPLFQIEAKGTLNGEKVEHQRTTFVKQLKLGKVSLCRTPGQLCPWSPPDPALLPGPPGLALLWGPPRCGSAPRTLGLALVWGPPVPLLSPTLPVSPPQLPQCLCIHLQRLSWSSHGAPLKRHEHVQFGEFLMMDIYKYHLLGHKPGHRSPERCEKAGPALELQDGPAVPKSGVCPRGRERDPLGPGATRARLARWRLKS